MTKSEALVKSAQITATIMQLILVKQKAEAVLAQAHEEAWPEDDARWALAFAEADAALDAAQARL